MISKMEWTSILEHRDGVGPVSRNFEEGHLASEYYTILNQVGANPHPRPLVFAHIAQTLDGRIACFNGDSKWIGNLENQEHAHRMRAICDAVMVGQNTLIHDQPQLTVRHVVGRNPIKLFLRGHSTRAFEYPKVCSLESEDHSAEIPWDNLGGLLLELGKLGVRSIYLEGGGKTLSYFLRKKLVDRLQVHIAPMILGSGFPAFTLPELDRIADALTMDNSEVYNINGHFMIAGQINYK